MIRRTVEELIGEVVGLRFEAHVLKSQMGDTHGLESMAFRKAYDFEQRIANAEYDLMMLADVLKDRPDAVGFRINPDWVS